MSSTRPCTGDTRARAPNLRKVNALQLEYTTRSIPEPSTTRTSSPIPRRGGFTNCAHLRVVTCPKTPRTPVHPEPKSPRPAHQQIIVRCAEVTASALISQCPSPSRHPSLTWHAEQNHPHRSTGPTASAGATSHAPTHGPAHTSPQQPSYSSEEVLRAQMRRVRSRIPHRQGLTPGEDNLPHRPQRALHRLTQQIHRQHRQVQSRPAASPPGDESAPKLLRTQHKNAPSATRRRK